MFDNIKNFIKGGFEEINEVFVKPFMALSFYQKCFFIIVAGLLLYVPYMNGFNATHDEQYTMLMCRFNVWDMIKTISIEDGHPPFSYLYSKFWIELFGGDVRNIFALRVATLFEFFMMSMLGVFPIKRLLNEKVALLFICFVFVLPSAFYLVMNMRMYPLAAFLMTGEFVYGMLAVYKPKKSDLFFFGLFSLLALYTHYYCAILSAVVWGIVFIDFLRLKRYKDLLPLFVCGGIVAVLFAPWLYAFLLQYQNMKDTWYPELRHAFAAIDGAFFSYIYILDIYYRLCLLLGMLCWAFVFEFLLDVSKEKPEHIIVKRATMVFWSIYIIALLISLFMRPNLAAIYLAIPVGVFYVAIAVSVLYFKKYRRLFLCSLFLVFVVGYSENYLKVQDETYQKISSYLKEEMPQNSLVLYNHTWGHLMMMFYASEKNIYFAPVERYIVLFQDEVKKDERLVQNLEQYDKIYYLLSVWDLLEYSNCEQQFVSEYDGISYCFRNLSVEDAASLIKRTKTLRNLSFHQKELK